MLDNLTELLEEKNAEFAPHMQKLREIAAETGDLVLRLDFSFEGMNCRVHLVKEEQITPLFKYSDQERREGYRETKVPERQYLGDMKLKNPDSSLDDKTRYEAAGQKEFLAVTKNLIETIQKYESHLVIGNVPEGCDNHQTATISVKNMGELKTFDTEICQRMPSTYNTTDRLTRFGLNKMLIFICAQQEEDKAKNQ